MRAHFLIAPALMAALAPGAVRAETMQGEHGLSLASMTGMEPGRYTQSWTIRIALMIIAAGPEKPHAYDLRSVAPLEAFPADVYVSRCLLSADRRPSFQRRSG